MGDERLHGSWEQRQEGSGSAGTLGADHGSVRTYRELWEPSKKDLQVFINYWQLEYLFQQVFKVWQKLIQIESVKYGQ